MDAPAAAAACLFQQQHASSHFTCDEDIRSTFKNNKAMWKVLFIVGLQFIIISRAPVWDFESKLCLTMG